MCYMKYVLYVIVVLISLFEKTITGDLPDDFGIQIIKCSTIKAQLHKYIISYVFKKTEDAQSNYMLGKIIQNMHIFLNQIILVIIEYKLE